jgi:Tfp pilus assembly pilus retraction ATPase PilT
VFPVEREKFVELRGFEDSLLAAIEAAESGYIVVTGLPGSGKSTSLSE